MCHKGSGHEEELPHHGSLQNYQQRSCGCRILHGAAEARYNCLGDGVDAFEPATSAAAYRRQAGCWAPGRVPCDTPTERQSLPEILTSPGSRRGSSVRVRAAAEPAPKRSCHEKFDSQRGHQRAAERRTAQDRPLHRRVHPMGGASVLTSFFGSPQNNTKGEARPDEEEPQAMDEEMQEELASPAPAGAEQEGAGAAAEQEIPTAEAPAAKVRAPSRTMCREMPRAGRQTSSSAVRASKISK